MTARDLYYSWHHFNRKALHCAALYEMGDDSVFTAQVYAQLRALIYARRLYDITGWWM